MGIDLDQAAPGIARADTDAFAWWIARAETPLRLTLRSFAGRVDVEAVLQETLLRVWQVAARFRPDGRPNGLLRLAQRIARNLAIDVARREPPVPEDADGREPDAIEPRDPDPLLRDAIERCWEELPPQPRHAITARIQSGGAEADRTLAERVGMRLTTFLQNVTRARQLLETCLAQRGIRLDEVWR